VVSPSDTLARALTLDDHCCHGSVLLLWEAERDVCGPLVTWETVVALVSLRLYPCRLQWCRWPDCSSLHCLHCFWLEGAELRLAEANLGIVILQGSSHLP